MAICTFFGHRNCTDNIDDKIFRTIVDLIENKNVNLFYVGNHGNFDLKTRNMLRILSKKYLHISYYVVLAYEPKSKKDFELCNSFPVFYPTGIEHISPRCAIIWRNNWMIDRSDYVITYVEHNNGGAYRFAETAKKKGKIVINLYKTDPHLLD